MSFSAIGSLRVYLDRGRGKDPRTLLAVSHQGDEAVHAFDADGVPTDEPRLSALIESAKGARIMANESDRDWAATYFGAPPARISSLPSGEEARLRLLAGRARKAAPPTPDPAPPPTPDDDRFWDDLEALLSDDPAPASGVEAVGAVPAPNPDGGDPLPDKLDAILSDIRPQEAGGKDVPARPSGLEGELGRMRALAHRMSDGILEDAPEDLRAVIEERAAALNAWPVPEPAEVETGPAAVAAPPGDDSVFVHQVLDEDRPGALRRLLRGFRDRTIHGPALAAVQAELHEAERDPNRFFGSGRRALWVVHRRAELAEEDRYICLAWTERLEGRCRLRMVRFNDASDLSPYQETAMRVLIERIDPIGCLTVEAILPPPLRISPDLMRAVGFSHLADLPRWFEGEDCAFWVRRPKF